MLGNNNSGMTSMETFGLKSKIWDFFIPTQVDSESWTTSADTGQALFQTVYMTLLVA